MPYTNNDIMDKLFAISLHQDSMKIQVTEIKEQVLRTNGRVTKTEEFINALKAVELYKKENPAPSTKTAAVPKWFQNEKLVGGVVAILLALAGAIGYIAAQAGGH